jgi:hypothetical protein
MMVQSAVIAPVPFFLEPSADSTRARFRLCDSLQARS